MTLREKLLASFHAVGTGTLRLDPHSAAAFALHIAAANEGIHVAGQLCTAPNAFKSETLALTLERWFRLLPEYDSPKRVLESNLGQARVAPELSAASSFLLHARVLEVHGARTKICTPG